MARAGATRRGRKAPPGRRAAPRLPARASRRLVPSREVAVWASVQAGPYGVLQRPVGDLERDPELEAAIAAHLVFPSLDITWSVHPEALAELRPDLDLDRLARVFGRAERAFLDVELAAPAGTRTLAAGPLAVDGPALQVLGLWPAAAVGGEEAPPAAAAGDDVVAGLVPILVPLLGPLGPLVRGAGVLFRAAFRLARRTGIVQLAYQRSERSVGWLFARGDRGSLVDGRHQAAVLLAVDRAAAAVDGARLAGTLRLAVDLENRADNVYLELEFAVPLAPYLPGRPVAPNPRIRSVRKAEELPMLLTVDEAASLLAVAPAAIWADGRFEPRFAGKFRSWVGPGPDGGTSVTIDRDSFVRFVLAELLDARSAGPQ